MSDNSVNELSEARYVSLATFRKSGTMVATPVWAAHDAGDFFIFSAGEAGKVKRLRNSSKAQLAVCDARGKLLGDWYPAEAGFVTEPVEVVRALAALRAKYGFTMVITDLLSRLTGRYQRRAYLKVRLNGVDGSAP